MMKEAARVEAKRVVVAEERGWRCGGILAGLSGRRRRLEDGRRRSCQMVCDGCYRGCVAVESLLVRPS